jgi:hypothetical protein
MIPHSLPILSDGVSRTTFEWGRIQSNSDWILPIGACLAIMLFVRYMYRRDSVELPVLVGWILTALRTAAFLGLLILFLQPHWRLEREVVRNSKAVLLVDTSLSMGLNAGELEPVKTPAGKQGADGHNARNGRSAAAPSGADSRLHQVASMLEETDFLARLRKTHDVSIYQFNDDLKTDGAVTLNKLVEPVADKNAAGTNLSDETKTDTARQASADAENTPDWEKILAPSGSETRLGQALRDLIQKERTSPLAGIVLFSDGGQNAGISPDAALELAREAKTPVFTVGLGSDKQPKNVRVSDLIVPARAYPGDRYTITGFLQAGHMAGEVVAVQVLSRPAGTRAADEGTGKVLDTQQVTLGADGEIVPVKFELTPEELGRRTICFRVQEAAGDQNPNDNFREAEIEIVDRKNHVLLLAGGPMRDYHFLRTLLHRDRSTTLDVLLQTGGEGMSQEGKILAKFPSTREAMYDYDCLVAFDPDWQALSAEQVELLENWVADQGGGLILVAGPIYTTAAINGWTQNRAMTPIRNLYPVEFPRRLSSAESGGYSTSEPWPLDFTREGLEADFLMLGDSATAPRRAWTDFAGVFSYSPVRKAKPGAAVYARFSDPRAAEGGEQPVYMAGQFYGSGRVFYLGSGEMWRLRASDEAYFEQFYTKLIRHVTQGRLLRGSSRGVLLTGQDRYLLGNSVEVRAQLMNSRLEPLVAPGVEMQIFTPNGKIQNLTLRPDPTRQGTYQGQFPVAEEGAYRLELTVPESDNERLIRRISARLPELERENPQRNDALLGQIARQTGGKYYVGVDAVFHDKSPLARQLPDRTSTIIQTDAPDPQWEETWLRWMMIALCGVLCLEWLIRRLVKLA